MVFSGLRVLMPKNETMAREIAELMLVSGKNGIWLDASTTCTRIECEGEYGVVFKASHPG